MRRTWEEAPEPPGKQFVKDPTTGRYAPNTILFTTLDKQFLRSIGWDPTKVVNK